MGVSSVNVSVEPAPGFDVSFILPGAHAQIMDFEFFDPDLDNPPTEL